MEAWHGCKRRKEVWAEGRHIMSDPTILGVSSDLQFPKENSRKASLSKATILKTTVPIYIHPSHQKLWILHRNLYEFHLHSAGVCFVCSLKIAYDLMVHFLLFYRVAFLNLLMLIRSTINTIVYKKDHETLLSIIISLQYLFIRKFWQ